MKRLINITALLLISSYLFSQKKTIYPIIPLPNNYIVKNGVFKLSEKIKIFNNDISLLNHINYFNNYLLKNNHFELQKTSDSSQSNSIILILNTKENFSNEAYELIINSNKIIIKGDPAGIFYGFQTLIQLINDQQQKEINLPILYINDEPSYKWRGMHLDVSRHFFKISFVKRYLDFLALYKLNTFHWHLTDDQGWRIEIKKYPKLTQIGAYRKGTVIGKNKTNKYDTINYGGFYTQDEIKEIVAYAKERFITVVPEIELPGHSVAAIAAYPYLSCTRKQVEVEKKWGVFDDVYCTKDSTFNFLEDVLSEVVSLFPGKYIHIGGDECVKRNWSKCKFCQDKIKSEGLKDENELQSYFIRRIEKFINSKDKQIIGWDEILEGGLAPNASVMSWRGIEGGIAAAKQSHFVVMSPGKPCYFDHYQSKNKKNEPLAIGGFNPLDSVYSYNPSPKELTDVQKKYIMGAQANVWTEFIINEKQLEYMALPRMCALAEAVWTKGEKKKYTDFIARLKEHRKLLNQMNVNYAKHFLSKN